MKSVVEQMAKQEQTLLETRPDMTELTDEDLEKVTGAWGGYYGYKRNYGRGYYRRSYYKKCGYGYGHQKYGYGYGHQKYGYGYGN